MTITLEAVQERIRSGDAKQATEALDAIEKSEGVSAQVWYLRGMLLEREYDRMGAFNCYQKALEQDPRHREAAFRAALLCDQAGDDEMALDLYEQCIEHPPVPVNALINLSVLYEEDGRFEDAERLLEAVIEEHPNHFRARQFLKSVESSSIMVYDEHFQRDREKRTAILDMPITDFELSVRSRNCLRQMNLRTLGDLLRTTEAELLAYKNFGETSLNEIKALLTQRGLKLGQALQVAAPADPAGPSYFQQSSGPETSVHARRSIAELELSVRSRKALQRLGVTTLGELAARSEAELMTIKNFGQTSLSEIKRQLALYGIFLRND